MQRPVVRLWHAFSGSVCDLTYHTRRVDELCCSGLVILFALLQVGQGFTWPVILFRTYTTQPVIIQLSATYQTIVASNSNSNS